MPRIVHFEIGVDDVDQARAFYEGVFGWQFHNWDGPEDYWLVTTGQDDTPGINGGLMRHRDGQPRTINTIDVDSVDAYAERVVANGGQVVVAKMAIPKVGYVAYCTDPEGVLFGIYETDEAAA